ncbi:uncharacterized protein AMSG_01164 [Thecamonas trahens ATCC 50062]|uniref:DNA2/NAM7 helicase helicase domain-containing protein n=1 Tax=Thecamonas trahens ATCC 50062 TaxID=461836 RepID=A0A0L0DN53_THETB|nr:hypothetical protein AMSG_01164 [Thecamonas trahens ATCC 50062]KNC53451.1 hypothetical protein AMSG_01164 [Thecamonas trahens ATCC 50062]|eukprot:XP_013761775.1 hypothetical protein AMSG_01164 [Thecamonas trahens ATCC 50062]
MNAFARELRSAVSKAGSYPVSALGDVLNKSPEALSEWEQLRSNLRPPPKLKKYVLSQVARWGLTLSSDGKLLTLSAPRTPTPGSPPGSQATSMASAGGGHHAGSGTSAAQGGAKIRPGQGSGSGAGSAPGGVALSGTTVADWVCTALGLAPPAVVPLHLSPLVGHFRLFACTQCLSQSSRLIPRDANSPMDTLCGSCGAPGSETMMFAARAAPNTPPSMLRWRRVTRRPSVASAAPDRFIFCAAAGSQGHDPGAVSEPMGALSGCSCPHSAAEAAEWNWDRPTAVELRDAWYIVNAGSSSVPVCAYCLTHHGLAIVLPEDYAPDLLVCPRSRSVAPSGATIDPHPWQPVKGPPRHDPPPSLYPQAVGSAPAGEAALLLGLPAAARAPPAHAATRIAPSDINAFLKWLHRQPVDPATSLIGLDSDSYRTLLHNVLLCDELALHDPRPVTAEYDPASPLGLTLWDVSAEDVSRCHSALSAPSASPSLSIWWPNSSSAEPDLTGTILSADLTGRTVVLRLSRPPARLPLPPVVLAKFPLSVVDTLRYTLMHHAVANVALDVVFPLMPMPENEPDSPVAVVDECLTPVQRQVIAHVLQPDPIPTLLEGPFGAGKTRTIKETLHHLLKNPASRILICTHTNSAADIYAGAFADSQWPASMVYRLMGSMRNPGSVPANIRGYTSPSPTGSGYTRDGKLTPHYVTHPADKLASFKVVVSTTVTAGNLALLGIQPGFFTHIIIDEAAQAAEAELLIPLLLAAPGATQLVLVSDHMQMDARTNVALSLRFGFSPRLVNLTACSLPRRLSMSASLSVHRIHFFQVFRSHPHIVNALAPIYGGQICAAPGSAAALALPDMLIDEAWPRLSLSRPRPTRP